MTNFDLRIDIRLATHALRRDVSMIKFPKTKLGLKDMLKALRQELRAMLEPNKDEVIARLRRRLADCVVWMDSREEAQVGMPRLCDMARDALKDTVPLVRGVDYHTDTDLELINEVGVSGLSYCPSTPPAYR